MRCKFLWGSAIAAAAWSGLAGGLAAADETSHSDAALGSSGEIQVRESPAAATPDKDAATPDAPAATPKAATPTPAKRRPAAGLARPTPTGRGSCPSRPPIRRPQRRPIAEQRQDRWRTLARQANDRTDRRRSAPPSRFAPSPIPKTARPWQSKRRASKGSSPEYPPETRWRRPGASPRTASRPTARLVQLYTIKPFPRVEVTYTDGKVSSVVIRFERSFPADAVAKQLDLATIRPVPVSNELGELLGLAYPERGVLFTFEPSDVPGKSTMKVPQVVLEPISAEAFVLRAETTHGEPARTEPPRPGAGVEAGAEERPRPLAPEPVEGGDRAAPRRAFRRRRGRAARARQSAVPRHLRPGSGPGRPIAGGRRGGEKGSPIERITAPRQGAGAVPLRRSDGLGAQAGLQAGARIAHPGNPACRSAEQRSAPGDPGGGQGGAGRRPSRRRP